MFDNLGLKFVLWTHANTDTNQDLKEHPQTYNTFEAASGSAKDMLSSSSGLDRVEIRVTVAAYSKQIVIQEEVLARDKSILPKNSS
jgi:hypothetical protein